MASSSPSRWRGPVALVAAFVVLDLAVILLVTWPSTKSEKVKSDLVPPSSAPASPVPATSRPRASPLRAALSAGGHPVAPRSPVAWPQARPIQGVRATWDEQYGDPFESDAGAPRDIRVLTQVGAFRLGVTNDTKIRDERATVAILQELGTEIDRRDQGRNDGFEKRILEYQEVFDRYRDRLRPHMDGSFALKGNGWSDTEPLSRPAARHDHDPPAPRHDDHDPPAPRRDAHDAASP